MGGFEPPKTPPLAMPLGDRLLILQARHANTFQITQLGDRDIYYLTVDHPNYLEFSTFYYTLNVEYCISCICLWFINLYTQYDSYRIYTT